GILTTDRLDEYFSDIINVSYTATMENRLDRIADGKENDVEVLRGFYNRFEPLLANAYESMERLMPEEVGEACPDCGSPLVYRTGRYGRFISCSNFPKCHYTRQIFTAEKEKPEEIGQACPECGNPLLKRKSRYGTYFIGCSNYPSCTYMTSLTGERIVSRASASAAKKTAGRMTTAKKTAAGKTAAKKTTAKKTAARKTTTKKAAAKKTAKVSEE
ncbi:MAG: topoisomerase DNA-binding C4 zinc finger domain-containing protein, partial [Solobacterium sp.]|nr:topoisomerase DNA-binding C4 zinc finger domain-containing protein [Solobacterium sp.]